jgi:hypothetical protein
MEDNEPRSFPGAAKEFQDRGTAKSDIYQRLDFTVTLLPNFIPTCG